VTDRPDPIAATAVPRTRELRCPTVLAERGAVAIRLGLDLAGGTCSRAETTTGSIPQRAVAVALPRPADRSGRSSDNYSLLCIAAGTGLARASTLPRRQGSRIRAEADAASSHTCSSYPSAEAMGA
jgi:hypothetical protein